MKGWYNDSYRHSLASRGVKTIIIKPNTKKSHIVHVLSSHPKVEEIYLYGSRARGDNNPDSDYDILVVMAPSINEKRDVEWVLNALPCPKYDVKVIGTDTMITKMVLVEDLNPSTDEGTWMSASAFEDAVLLYRRRSN